MYLVKTILTHYNYWVFSLLLVIALYAMMVKSNLMKKLIGMNIFQWTIIFFFISIAAKKGAQIPIGSGHGVQTVIRASEYIIPLPHVLMLTAIVVGVATTGIALALLIAIYRRYDTLQEDDILRRLRR